MTSTPYASTMTTDYLAERAAYSETRIAELRTAIEAGVADIELKGLTIFAAGSFARLEGSQHSDVDLFFTYHPTQPAVARRTNELRLFGRLIDIATELGFPAFSNDAEYLRTHPLSDILSKLGGPDDDALNHFTLRMLLLLESKCVYGDAEYIESLRQIIHYYFRDFSRNESEFQPWFLTNDIMRYWKTLLLNYENRRHSPDIGPESQETDETIQNERAKNFKLRFSRMTTCFATVAALGCHAVTAREEDVLDLVLMTPQDRLRAVAEKMPSAAHSVGKILEDYAWFLEQTSLSKPELHAKFRDDATRQQMFQRAEEYGTKLYHLLLIIDQERGSDVPDFIRYLVI